jgi:hypothetical protein
MKFNASIIATLLTAVLKLISPEMLRSWLVSAIESLEAVILKSENKVDDAVLPLLATIRAMLNGE